MSAVYYRVTGEEVLAFCKDYRGRRTAVRERFFDFAKEKGAKGFIEWWGRLGGVVFERGAEIGPEWKKHKRPASDGSTIYIPSRRKDGKTLRAEIDALGSEPRGHEFAKHFGVPDTLEYFKDDQNKGWENLSVGFLDTAFITWVDDEFFVLLPDIAARIAARAAEGWTCTPSEWSPPEGLERSSRAQYELAVAQQAVAQEAAQDPA